jgi:cardiolipin synthase (CMP-forming)
MKRHIPNLLTVARLALAPYVFLLMTRREYGAVIPWFIVIAATDSLDGYLARRWRATSRWGAYLDPLADKLLLSGSFLVLALTGGIEWWLATVVLGRDALILLGAGILYLRKASREFPPSVWGKLSSFAQILFLGFRLGVLVGIAVSPIALALQWMVAALTVASLADYGRRMVHGPALTPSFKSNT